MAISLPVITECGWKTFAGQWELVLSASLQLLYQHCWLYMQAKVQIGEFLSIDKVEGVTKLRFIFFLPSLVKKIFNGRNNLWGRVSNPFCVRYLDDLPVVYVGYSDLPLAKHVNRLYYDLLGVAKTSRCKWLYLVHCISSSFFSSHSN